jgi:hypothetical protein
MGPKLFFPLSLPILPAQIQKKSQNNISMLVPIRVGGLLLNNFHLLAPDFPLALCATRSHVMWTVLFSFVFVAAVALHLAAMSQVDFD